MRITDTDLKIGYLLYPESQSLERPKTRGDCPNVRPCAYIGCRFNLYIDTNGDLGADASPWTAPPEGSCALDVADEGGKSLEEIAAIMQVTRERVRQILEQGMAKMKKTLPYATHRHLTVISE